MEKAKEKRLVVVAVRHFMNGEHHWYAPKADVHDDPYAFSAVDENSYGLPVFRKVEDAADWAYTMVHDEWTLASWESRRPTFLVVEEETYLAIVEKDSYEYPPEAVRWCDAKVADFERECDCEDYVKAAMWDSDGEERIR